MATIKVHGRVHPCCNPTSHIDIQGNRLVVSKTSRGSSSRVATEIGFTYDNIFNTDATQKDIFDNAAKGIVEKFLDGYNGTIFAYGQTGSGKTYTIDGEELTKPRSARHGLIPQTLSFLFKEIEDLKDECVSVKVSFLEVYNETAYDLLGTLIYGTKCVRDLPKVLVSLGSGGSCFLHGLTIHDVNTEFEARKLHLRGRNNQVVAATPNNERSSRSHAIFIIWLTRQKHGSEVVVKSKLNLVDLAGSESLSVKSSRSMSSNTLNNESKHINLSLHYLETVIIALQRIHTRGIPAYDENTDRIKIAKRCESAHTSPLQHRRQTENHSSLQGLKCSSALSFHEMARKGSSVNMCMSPYISYRNSLLTMVLQDSLGGNCNTVMIATLSLEACNITETILTCRFAQRVARVTNNPVINKTINEEALIQKLENKVTKLSEELEMVKQKEIKKECSLPTTTEEQLAFVVDTIDSYLNGQTEEPITHGINDSNKIRIYLAHLKGLLMDSKMLKAAEPDERDSGFGTDTVPTNNNSEDEPCSPTLTDGSRTSSKDGIAGSTANQPTKAQLTETKQHSVQPNHLFFPSPNSSQQDKPLKNTNLMNPKSSDNLGAEQEQPTNSGKSDECPSSSQILLPLTAHQSEYSDQESKKLVQSTDASLIDNHKSHLQSRPTSSQQCCTSKCTLKSSKAADNRGDQDVIEDSLKKLKLLELELEKEKLIHKSKLLSTALSNQKARIMVMDKRGCPLDDIDNERLAEQQLRGKQAYVEQQLSIIVKRIVETKSLSDAARTEVRDKDSHDKSELKSPEKPVSEKTLKYHNLELKQQSTRQKLLACREKLMPSLLLSIENPTKSLNSEKRRDTMICPVGDVCSKQQGRSCSPDGKNNQYQPVKSLSELKSPGIQTNNNLYKATKNASKSGNPYENESKRLSKRTSLSCIQRGMTADSKGRGAHERLLVQSIKKAKITTTHLRRNGLSSAANRQNLMAFNTQQSYMKRTNTFPQLRKMTLSMKTDRNNPRMRGSAVGARASRYEFEQGEGFIVCRDSKVYQQSVFKSDNFVEMRAKNSQSTVKEKRPVISNDMQKTAMDSPSPEGDRRVNVSTSRISTWDGRQSTILPSNKKDICERENNLNSPHRSGNGDDPLTCFSSLGGSEGGTCCVEDGRTMPQYSDRVSETKGSCTFITETNSSPPTILHPTLPEEENVQPQPPLPKMTAIQLQVSPSVLKARKQQLERAKRIREVTKAVEIIQSAYRRYQSHKKG